jgi:hypothetical protein
LLVTVAAFRDPYEAHLLRGRLAAEGIYAVVAHEMHVANKWPLSVALGGVKVQVSKDQIETARGVERDCCDGVFRALLQDELGDLDDPACPRCGCGKYRKRRPLPRAALAVVLSLYWGAVIPPLGWIHRCEGCGREYRGPRRHISKDRIILAVATALLVMVGYAVLQHYINRIFGCEMVSFCL